ncbi:hypothetical protein KNLIENLN_00010 [Sinorhizobium phage NV1.1.1]|nr:hypothetical protein KNLIENLN_00010 [Sinorhizobium phage NV1.1.1]
MTSFLPLRVVIELGRPSLRLLLLCRSNFLDVIDIKRDRRGNTAKPDGDHAVVAYSRDGACKQNAGAFFDLTSHQHNLALGGATARGC